MTVTVTLPALGESVTEGTVTRWLKQVGERVAADEPLLEVSTDKVDTEIPSPATGVLLSIAVAEDETVEVGAELAVIGTADAVPAAAPAPPAEAPQAAPASSPALSPASAPVPAPVPVARLPPHPSPRSRPRPPPNPRLRRRCRRLAHRRHPRPPSQPPRRRRHPCCAVGRSA